MRRLDGVETFDFDLASGEAVLGVRPGTVLHEDQVRAGVTGAGLVLESLTAPTGDAPGVCVVSGRPLPTDGVPVEIEHAGRKVQLCCGKCIAEFRADPEKFLAKLP